MGASKAGKFENSIAEKPRIQLYAGAQSKHKRINRKASFPTFVRWLTEDHPSMDGNAVSKIEKIVNADKDHLAESWFKGDILGALDKVTID